MSWGSSTEPLLRAQPLSNFLVGAGCLAAMRCCHGHRPQIRSKLLHDHRGKGNEMNRRENRERGEWGIDLMHSNKARVNGIERRQDNTQE